MIDFINCISFNIFIWLFYFKLIVPYCCERFPNSNKPIKIKISREDSQKSEYDKYLNDGVVDIEKVDKNFWEN